MAGNKLVINTDSTARVRPSSWVSTVRENYTSILACQGFISPSLIGKSLRQKGGPNLRITDGRLSPRHHLNGPGSMLFPRDKCNGYNIDTMYSSRSSFYWRRAPASVHPTGDLLLHAVVLLKTLQTKYLSLVLTVEQVSGDK